MVAPKLIEIPCLRFSTTVVCRQNITIWRSGSGRYGKLDGTTGQGSEIEHAMHR